MSNVDKRNDPRSTEELIRLALTKPDEHRAWEAVTVLHFRGTQEVLAAAQMLCKSQNPRERQLGADILGQLGVGEDAFHEERLSILLELLNEEENTDVLSAACIALGHVHDARAIVPVARLKNHPSKDVRYAVVHGLFRHRDDLAVATLIELTRDVDSDVRDWATFELGSILEDVDTRELREALVERLADPDDDTRAEALVGLSKRKDDRMIEPLIREIDSQSIGSLALEAAVEMADQRLCPALLRLKGEIGEDAELEEALRSCNCEEQ